MSGSLTFSFCPDKMPELKMSAGFFMVTTPHKRLKLGNRLKVAMSVNAPDKLDVHQSCGVTKSTTHNSRRAKEKSSRRTSWERKKEWWFTSLQENEQRRPGKGMQRSPPTQ